MRFALRLAAAVALALSALAHADPDEYVQVPGVEYGEREIDLKYGTRYFNDTHQRESAGSVGLGWGPAPWWFTEAYFKYHKEDGERTRYDELELENKFQLTETNKYPVDVGLLAEIEVPRAREEGRYLLKAGPLLQFDTGPLRWNTNVFFERAFDARTDEPHETQLQYQAQVAYRVRRGFDVGVQAFGDLGKWNDWAPRDEQSHRIGPAIFGKVKLGEGRQAIRYNAAWLFGASKAAADNALRVQVEYEF